MDHPAPPPVETVEISRLFCSPTNPRKNDAAIPHVAPAVGGCFLIALAQQVADLGVQLRGVVVLARAA